MCCWLFVLVWSLRLFVLWLLVWFGFASFGLLCYDVCCFALSLVYCYSVVCYIWLFCVLRYVACFGFWVCLLCWCFVLLRITLLFVVVGLFVGYKLWLVVGFGVVIDCCWLFSYFVGYFVLMLIVFWFIVNSVVVCICCILLWVLFDFLIWQFDIWLFVWCCLVCCVLLHCCGLDLFACLNCGIY